MIRIRISLLREDRTLSAGEILMPPTRGLRAELMAFLRALATTVERTAPQTFSSSTHTGGV